jgi:tRNA modification GTPase
MDNSTIAAIATPLGSGGIGIIRISGSQAIAIATAVFQPSRDRSRFKSHRFRHGYVVDPKTHAAVDEAYLVIMKAPRSYTREDVAEIQTHGGPVVLKTVLELVLQAGARLAKAGEFTQRAFLNGRIDLSQAEAVADMIGAKSEKALQIAASQIQGTLRREIESLRRSILKLYSGYEAAIEYSEEIEETALETDIQEEVETKIIPGIENLLKRFRTGVVLKEGIRVAIAGRPNVGKSSMMNCLLEKDRVIVSPIPGTTRDFIEETFMIDGVSVLLVDTAGLGYTEDPLEQLGVQKSKNAIQGSDLVLFMVEAHEFPNSGDMSIYDQIRGKPKILVLNKSDLLLKQKEIFFPEEWKGIPWINTSALHHQGIEDLKNRILSVVFKEEGIDIMNPAIPNLRHKVALERARDAMLRFYEGIRSCHSPELLVLDLKESTDALGEILGETGSADILDEIFNRFCVGK